MPTVEEVMTRGVISIREDAFVEEAMKAMIERHVSALIVEKASEADIDGIITRKDIINKVIAPGRDPKKIRVHEVMTKPLMTVTKKMDVMHVARLMARTEVRRFPVRECDRIVGIISNSDIFRAYVLDNVTEKKTKKP
jgi:CBS domain-containing protein